MTPAGIVSLLLRLALFGAVVLLANKMFDRVIGPLDF